MAKRRTKRKTSRRRVGSAALSPASPLVQLGSLAVGYLVGGSFINGMIDKAVAPTGAVPATTNKLIGAAEAGIGGFLVMSKKKRSLIKTVAGGILAGAGVKRLLGAFNVVTPAVTGFQNVPVVGRPGMRMVRGFRDVPVVAGGPALTGYTPTGSNALTGYNIGKSTYSQVMGNASGSDLTGR